MCVRMTHMPRYFFDIYTDGKVQSDDEGVELANLSEACKQAQNLLPDIAHEEVHGGERWTLTVMVRDESGIPVYAAALTYAGQRLAL